jgi:hypothetical protein
VVVTVGLTVYVGGFDYWYHWTGWIKKMMVMMIGVIKRNFLLNMLTPQGFQLKANEGKWKGTTMPANFVKEGLAIRMSWIPTFSTTIPKNFEQARFGGWCYRHPSVSLWMSMILCWDWLVITSCGICVTSPLTLQNPMDVQISKTAAAAANLFYRWYLLSVKSKKVVTPELNTHLIISNGIYCYNIVPRAATFQWWIPLFAVIQNSDLCPCHTR